MILNPQRTAFEYEKKSGKHVHLPDDTNKLVHYKVIGLTRGLIIPDDLIAKMESFMKRNSIKEANHCCPNCLKAHILKTANDIGISRDGKQFLSLFIGGEAGHNGYYLDGDELVKI